MTEREKAAYRELLERTTFISSKTHMLISDCKDADGRVLRQESDVRREILASVADLCRWAGCRCELQQVRTGPKEPE